jgi:hypothetical protein
VIYIRRDLKKIPEKLLKEAALAQEELMKLPLSERIAFIKKKSFIWRAFARYLAQMSYGKCWYSESIDVQSFFDVDHFRPKGEAIREEGHKDEGYPWLAFDWTNFRYSAQRSNRLSTNDASGETEGKGSWFPLLPGSKKATWDDRCESEEKAILLDPTCKEDVALVDVGADGRIIPSLICVGKQRVRLKRSSELLGLNLDNLVGARKKAIRDVNEQFEILSKTLAVANQIEEAAVSLPVYESFRLLRRWSQPNHPYSLTIRATLFRLGAPQICAPPEELDHEKSHDSAPGGVLNPQPKS